MEVAIFVAPTNSDKLVCLLVVALTVVLLLEVAIFVAPTNSDRLVCLLVVALTVVLLLEVAVLSTVLLHDKLLTSVERFFRFPFGMLHRSKKIGHSFGNCRKKHIHTADSQYSTNILCETKLSIKRSFMSMLALAQGGKNHVFL